MRHGFAVLAVAALAIVVPGAVSTLCADQPPHLDARDGAEPGWDVGSRQRVAGYASYFVYRRRFGNYGYGRPWRRYVYRCRRFSFQCSYRPVRAYFSDTVYAAYGYSYADDRRTPVRALAGKVGAATVMPPARLGRYYVNPETGRPRGVAGSRTPDGAYDGRRARLVDESGGFVRIPSPGRSGRWVLVGDIAAQ